MAEQRTLSDVIMSSYGVQTTYRENPVTTAVAASETKILSYNPNRVGLIIVNQGASSINITPGRGASVTNGIRLIAGGGAVTYQWDTDFELVASEFYAIGVTGVSTVYILEVVTSPTGGG